MKISIIIPVYNAASTIRRTIASIDTKHDFEVICVNDGSTDDTQDVLKQLQKEYKHIQVINQENKGAAASRNVGLTNISGDVFMFIDADDIFLPGRIDLMANCYQKDSNVEIVIGQIGRGVSGEWKPVPTHEAMCKDMKVNLAQSPEIMQSIGPGAKLFSADFKSLRFDEDIVFCEEHSFIIQAYRKAKDIQVLSEIVYGYHEVEGSVTQRRATEFLAYMSDAREARARVMPLLPLRNQRIYYSYRMDELIVSYLIQAYLTQNSELNQSLLDVVINYLDDMQRTDYSGEALFRIVNVVEHGSTKWNKVLYEQWKSALLRCGIGRPNYLRFKVEVLPKRTTFRGKQKLKQYLNR
ncbi:glycosyltransferase family 2 protein [Staphylococcus gallinarum]|uniref:Glycosyltransferase family 2 protein n=1 Tax=Staphylococcus gallinarum TaxID=1293 RepID=A0A2T4SWE1_STAGA|nr:glycosyltransferase family 2 protein [Staphylococcus gallinarum]MCD8821702.1 glycosyltransferase family 2 protein [Staphylococcus gallinarum]MCD8871937.1 glycosyltransferase family 2 protein [Staphylococcus gallinarum]MCW0984229.1 glycosyltransferase family 2 protein [Staphylococcus gallinarum]PTL08574.1 glycosyltransferase family 2 protein [Staphylococcus gallinarum]PTL09213.1 glycosyltransferase family 2 protein [Staphylococcus gallinarum]